MSKNAEHLEDISQLKARYFRLMDTQQWDSWHNCFTDDVSATYEGAPRISEEEPEDIHITGREELVEGKEINDRRMFYASGFYARDRNFE